MDTLVNIILKSTVFSDIIERLEKIEQINRFKLVNTTDKYEALRNIYHYDLTPDHFRLKCCNCDLDELKNTLIYTTFFMFENDVFNTELFVRKCRSLGFVVHHGIYEERNEETPMVFIKLPNKQYEETIKELY
eukprot:Pgem_evm1s4391